jgi:hypothetical protein
MVAVGGGYPILEDGKLIGGIGISGATISRIRTLPSSPSASWVLKWPKRSALSAIRFGHPPANGGGRTAPRDRSGAQSSYRFRAAFEDFAKSPQSRAFLAEMKAILARDLEVTFLSPLPDLPQGEELERFDDSDAFGQRKIARASAKDHEADHSDCRRQKQHTSTNSRLYGRQPQSGRLPYCPSTARNLFEQQLKPIEFAADLGLETLGQNAAIQWMTLPGREVGPGGSRSTRATRCGIFAARAPNRG